MEKQREDKVKTLRLLQIDDIIRSGIYPDVQKLMDETEASRRTILRDIEFIRDRYNAPLEYSRERHGYYYSDSTYFIKSVMLSEGELFAVSLLLPLLEQYKNTPLEGSFKNILTKLSSLLPNQVQVDSTLISGDIQFISDPLPTINEDVFNNVFQAIKTSKTMEFGYRSLSSTEYSYRQFDAYKVLCQKGNWYVAGWCHKHKDMRVYALSRMKNLKLTNDTFEQDADFEKKLNIDPSFGVWSKESAPVKIELVFDAKINTLILERVWHADQECHQNEDGSVYLSFMSNQMEETLYWVLHFGSAVKVINPPELKAKVREEAQKILENQ